MKKIFKQALEFTDGQFIVLPKSAKILCVQVQRKTPTIWYLCDPEELLEQRTITFFGTGAPLNDDVEKYTYIGTFQVHDGALVLHAFEVPK